jgi:hypothetical protein
MERRLKTSPELSSGSRLCAVAAIIKDQFREEYAVAVAGRDYMAIAAALDFNNDVPFLIDACPALPARLAVWAETAHPRTILVLQRRGTDAPDCLAAGAKALDLRYKKIVGPLAIDTWDLEFLADKSLLR